MGVTILTRKPAGGEVAFSPDDSKTKYKRFRQNTGIKAPLPQTCKACKIALKEVERFTLPKKLLCRMLRFYGKGSEGASDCQKKRPFSQFQDVLKFEKLL